MEEIKFVGEHLWAGYLGHAFVLLSFVAAILSLVTYVLAVKNNAFLKLARFAFNLHSLSVLGIAGTLFYMLFSHFYEYQYVWQHSNNEMNMKYILSCFWEGQEGSFLLWTFWNIVLGLMLKRQLRQSDWEMPVMAVFALVQVFLTSMILGIYIGDYKIGTGPFMLLRELPDYKDMPFVKMPNYLEKLNGRGLNPLLMNYWMTIHPPTLFLGFASTLVPFAFSLAALWNKKYTQWQKLALPWTFFGITVLGVGILMGGAWAYEALSFGGFWAWDPVENSSLVPWLVLVAAGHTMIINRNKGGSLFTTHFLSICGFLLVLYSTFLTRSGVLGTSSVHAFTDLGMTGQLVLYVLTFIFLSVALLIREKLFQVTYIVLSLLAMFFGAFVGYAKILLLLWSAASTIITVVSYYRYFPKEENEESLYSREFWLFLGSLILILSALIITYFTSLPVINKLFGTKYAKTEIEVYNQWMLPFAIIMMILIAGAQFLKYKKTGTAAFLQRIAYSFLLALVFGLVITIPLYFLNGFADSKEKGQLVAYAVLFVVALFGFFANADYFLLVLKGKIRKSGASIAHMGFALIMIGVLVSTSKKTIISANTAERKVSSLGSDFDDRKSILLTQGDTLPMGPYYVTYVGKRRIGIDVYFDVDYFKKSADSSLVFDFRLVPHIQDNPRMGKAPEPATKHYLNRDVYTHIVAADLKETSAKEKDGYTSAINYIGHVGDTITSSNALIIIDSLRSDVSEAEFAKNDSHLEVTAVLKCVDVKNNVFYARPRFVIENNIVIPKEDLVEPLGLKLVFWKINPNDNTVEITLSERLSNNKDFIVMEAAVFPYINVLWLGCLVMAVGTVIAVIERLRVNRIQANNNEKQQSPAGEI